jgi:hypothetical protein
MSTSHLPARVRNWPLWWFAHLEAAIERGDHQAAAKAQGQLERLGVTVQYRSRWADRTDVRASHAPR